MAACAAALQGDIAVNAAAAAAAAAAVGPPVPWPAAAAPASAGTKEDPRTAEEIEAVIARLEVELTLMPGKPHKKARKKVNKRLGKLRTKLQAVRFTAVVGNVAAAAPVYVAGPAAQEEEQFKNRVHQSPTEAQPLEKHQT